MWLANILNVVTPWLKYWRIGIGLLLLLTIGILSFLLKSSKADLRDEKTAHAQSETNYQTCQAEIVKRDAVSEENQTRITDLNNRLNAERMRRQSPKCIPIIRKSGTTPTLSQWRFPN